MEVALLNSHVNKYMGKTVIKYGFDLRCIQRNGLQNPLAVFIIFKCDCASSFIFKQYFEPSMGSKYSQTTKL